MPQAPKIKSFNIFAVSPEKNGSEVDFFPTDRHKSFLQVDSIILGVAKIPKAKTTSLHYLYNISRKT